MMRGDYNINKTINFKASKKYNFISSEYVKIKFSSRQFISAELKKKDYLNYIYKF